MPYVDAPHREILVDDVVRQHIVEMQAEAKYGKGFVVAVTDPWLYNEYTDGRKPKMPAVYNNFAGGQEFVHWILEQRAKHGPVSTGKEL